MVFLVLLTPALWLAHAVATDQLPGDTVKILEIDTGTLALRSLALTLAVTPIRQLTGWRWLATYRRMLGLFAFFYATVHMLVYFGLDLELQFGEIWASIVKRPYITVGMLSWLILVPLAITSPHVIAKRLGGVRWKRLHRLTYVGRDHRHDSLSVGGKEGHVLAAGVFRVVCCAAVCARGAVAACAHRQRYCIHFAG